MKINLKELAEDVYRLKYIQKILGENQETKTLSRKLNRVLRLMEEIEVDLEMCGESITELDKSRTEAIQERDKRLPFMSTEDE